MAELRDLLLHTAHAIADYRESLPQARVFPAAELAVIRSGFGLTLPDRGIAPAQVLQALIAAAAPGLVATAGPRYFGFVIGGALPAATAAEMLATGWDQNAYSAASSPAAAAVEETTGAWLKELLGIPPAASFGFVTGGQAANTVGLAAARQHVLQREGWDVARDGLFGAPRVRVVASVERHATIDGSLRLLGFGAGGIEEVTTDANGAIDVTQLIATLARGERAPTIVILQAGNVNTGACDDLERAIAAAKKHGAWVHIDGAFGLWAAASTSTRSLVAGLEHADSWACDGHKWLNVPHDSGYVFSAHPEAHRAAMALHAAYLTGLPGGELRSPGDFVPESSRRARGFATWAALSELGRSGVASLVERCCLLARRFAEQLKEREGVEVVNDVVLNQVLVRFGDSDACTLRVIDRVQQSGECWMGGTRWRGQQLMRIAVSNATTTEADVDRSVAAVLKAFRSE
ncbi:MAG: aspartate aminotransferase family protein [Myxococcaceae bacterium]|nr:aspartate aminotransferase family protein [Myxococcaceae bacterium]